MVADIRYFKFVSSLEGNFFMKESAKRYNEAFSIALTQLNQAQESAVQQIEENEYNFWYYVGGAPNLAA